MAAEAFVGPGVTIGEGALLGARAVAAKDLDLFLRRCDFERAAKALEQAGYRTELTFPHWLGKAHHDGFYIDLIFSSGNAVAEVDDLWFAYAIEEEVLGLHHGTRAL